MRRSFLIAAAAIAGVLATIAWPPAPDLVWNASSSSPRGLYAVLPGAVLLRGDMAIAHVPARWRQFAARRGYIPKTVPLVKRVAALSGIVCGDKQWISVDGRKVARRLERDPQGRVLPWWQGCVRLKPGQLLLLGPARDSFDGRYFGINGGKDVIGKARLLWRA